MYDYHLIVRRFQESLFILILSFIARASNSELLIAFKCHVSFHFFKREQFLSFCLFLMTLTLEDYGPKLYRMSLNLDLSHF